MLQHFERGLILPSRNQTRSDEVDLVEKEVKQVKLLNLSSLNQTGFAPSQLGSAGSVLAQAG